MLPPKQTSFYYFTCLPRREHINVVIIGKDGAFIVNVPHNLIVTTMNGNEMKENIFTNIDSAVLL